MAQKILRNISYVVVFLACLSLFGFAVKYVSEGGTRLGPLTKPLEQFSSFPGTAISVVKELKQSSRLISVDSDFEAVNALTYDVYALNSYFEKGRWVIRLFNFRTDSVIHEWYLTQKDFKAGNREFAYSEPREPILLEDRSIIFACDETNNLYRLDRDSRVVWHNTEHRFHHSLATAADGNIWVCTRSIVRSREAQGKFVRFWDNGLAKIDVSTGETLYKESIADVLVENGLAAYVYGMSNVLFSSGRDPLHLNEVEPVLTDGPYWKTGDVFMSFRNRSLVVLFRPSTNELLRVIHGPFFGQHDVDIQSDSTISIFNNNVSLLKPEKPQSPPRNPKSHQDHPYSEVLVYNLSDSTFTSYFRHHFMEHQIKTATEGLHTILSNGDLYVEDQNHGKVYIFGSEEVLLKRYMGFSDEGVTQRPHWVRIYENIDF